MKPREALETLDRRIRYLERQWDTAERDSGRWHAMGMEIAALRHANRLIAFEIQYIDSKVEDGTYAGERKKGEFLRGVVAATPLEIE